MITIFQYSAECWNIVNDMRKIRIGFGEVGKNVGEFVEGNKNFLQKIDFVVGMSRGGLAPAALLAAKIDKPLVAAYINKQDEIFFDRASWIESKNILIVDDIIRSGKTLWLLKNHLQVCCRPREISFFALYRVSPLQNESYNIRSFSRGINEDVIFPWD